MALLPAHPHGVADHHIKGQVVVELHLGVGRHEGHQGEQALAAELAVFRGLDLAEQLLHQGGEVAFPRGLLAHQRSALQTVASLELVADHHAAAVVQQIPDAGIEIAGHPAQGPEPHAVLQPALPAGQLLEGIGNLPAHPTAQVELLLALQGCPGVIHISQHGAKAAADPMGRLAAEGLERVAGAEVLLGRQFAREQQQQLAELEGEGAAEEIRFQSDQAIHRQQQLLLEHPLAAILTAEAADHGGDPLAAVGLADQRLVRVVAAHHHLLLTHQQVGEGILELGVHQAHGAGHSPHHVPVGFLQAAAVHLLQQGHRQHRRAALGAPQEGVRTEAPRQQFQHLRLFLQRGAPP